MDSKKRVGKWIDEMNSYSRNEVRSTRKVRFFERIKNILISIDEVVARNWFIITISSLVAIPLLIISLYIVAYIGSKITDPEQLRLWLTTIGTLLCLPAMFVYFYLVKTISGRKRPTARAIFISIFIVALMLNIVAAVNYFKHIEGDNSANIVFSYRVFFLDGYMVSFMITKLSYLLGKKIINQVKTIANWVVDEDTSNDELLKAKLSFINKIITGFLALVASILGLILTLNKILY